MKKDLYDIMLNPNRMRIVQVLAGSKTMTVKEIEDLIANVPRTTLYRHINVLIEAEVVTVVEEKKIRGSLERTLALNTEEIKKNNNMEDIPKQAFRFLMNTYSKFEKYFGDKNRKRKNKIFFNNTIMMMSDREFDEFLMELQSLLVRYNYEETDGRRPRDISIISSPPIDNN